jgi:hypothetical protein
MLPTKGVSMFKLFTLDGANQLLATVDACLESCSRTHALESKMRTVTSADAGALAAQQICVSYAHHSAS